MKVLSKILTAAVLLLSMGILGGCRVKLSHFISYDRLAEELSEHNIANTAFDSDNPMLNQRIVMISGGFNRSMAQSVCGQLLYLNEQDHTKPITLLINSNGGDCTSYQSIASIIKSLEAPVDTVNIGVCASMGALLIQSATGQRYAVSNTMFLIHEPSGKPKEITKGYKELQEKILQTKCSLPEEWLPIGNKQHIFSADKALEYQFVDEVVESIQL